MKARVDPTKCRSYGVCVQTCPEVFELDEWGQSFVVEKYAEGIPPRLREQVLEAVASCPQQAIVAENLTDP